MRWPGPHWSLDPMSAIAGPGRRWAGREGVPRPDRGVAAPARPSMEVRQRVLTADCHDVKRQSADHRRMRAAIGSALPQSSGSWLGGSAPGSAIPRSVSFNSRSRVTSRSITSMLSAVPGGYRNRFWAAAWIRRMMSAKRGSATRLSGIDHARGRVTQTGWWSKSSGRVGGVDPGPPDPSSACGEIRDLGLSPR